MTPMKANDSTSASPRESFYLGEPVSVVGVCVDEEMWRFLGLFADSTGLIQLRTRVGDYRSAQDQDAVLEDLGNPAPDICLVYFDQDRRSAAILVKINQANIRGGIAEVFQDRILILSAPVVSDSSPQLDQPGRVCKQTQKTPHFFVNANANDGNRLTQVKAFSGGSACGIVGLHRCHCAPAPWGCFACLLPGACSSNLLMSRNGTGTFGAAGIGVST